MEILGDLNTRIYPCKILTFWYTGYDGMTVHVRVQIHVSISHQHVHVHCTHTFPYFPLIFTHREKLMYVQLCTYISFSRNQLGGREGRPPPHKKLGPPSKMWLFIVIARRKREKRVLSLAQYYHNTSKVSWNYNKYINIYIKLKQQNLLYK